MTATAAYEIYRAQALGESQRELKKFMKRQLGLSNKEIRRLFRQAARMSRDNDEEHVGLTSGADMAIICAAWEISCVAGSMAALDMAPNMEWAVAM